MASLSTTKLNSKTHSTKFSKTEVSQVPSDISSSKLPFREWSDKEVREECWDDPDWPQSKTTHSQSSTYRLDYVQVPDEPRRFQDEQFIHLPHSIKAHQWKSAHEVFPKARLEVYVKSENYPDLISASKHLLHSKFVRSFISSIHTMMYLGNTTKFTTQYISLNFLPSIGNRPWRPWFHVYSNQLAGTRENNVPTINKIGKYIVRLFWLGTWRKIYVDDKLPVDLIDNVMLPSVVRPKAELHHSHPNEQVVELWPYLIAKALLKIASLTWYEDEEIVDFDILQCLTGWVPQKIDTRGLPISEIWNICWAYTSHFTRPPEKLSKEGGHMKKNKSIKEKDETEEGDDKGAKENKQEFFLGKVEEERQIHDFSKVVDKGNTVHYLTACCNDLRNFVDDDEIQHFSPCWSHEFLIDQTRDIPLRRSVLTEGLDNWKRIRWLNWAKKNELIPFEDLFTENSYYKVVSAFRNVSENVVYKQPSKIRLELPPPEPMKKENKESEKTKKEKERGARKKNKESPRAKSRGDDAKGKKKENLKANKGTKNHKSLVYDPSFWVDHKQLAYQINTITVYFKPTEMKTKIKISDLKENSSKGDDEWMTVEVPLVMENSRNEPVYIFSESIDSKILIINLSQAGYMDMLQEESKRKVFVVPDTTTECEFCLAALVKRIKTSVNKKILNEFIPAPRYESKLVIHERSRSHFVLEEYNWQSDRLGDTVTTLNTYGSKTTTLTFGPGRKIFKLWIKSDTSYVLSIFSDDPVTAGDLKTLLVCMSQESQLLQEKCNSIANNFLSLLYDFGSPTFPSQLKTFYDSYKPEGRLTKAESNLVHDAFHQLLLELVENRLGKEKIGALRILFMRWQRDPRPSYPGDYNLCNCYEDADLEYLKALERYVVRIQALLRGFYERNLKKHHQKSHECFNKIEKNLLDIYSEIFSIQNRNLTCPGFVRALLAYPDMDKIKRKYSLYKDLGNVLVLKEFSHRVKVSEGEWTPICRQQFSVESDYPIPVKINLFCDFDHYVVRVVDNDTAGEIKRYTNNVAVRKYPRNQKGYTVICYAWSPITRNTNCTLNFAIKKEIQCDNLNIPKISSEYNSFYGMYIPNVNNNVCKYTIRLRSESALLSAHITTSHSGAIVKLKLYDDRGKLLQEITGKGNVILPAVLLAYQERHNGRASLESTATLGRDRSTKIQSFLEPYPEHEPHGNIHNKLMENKSSQRISANHRARKFFDRSTDNAVKGQESSNKFRGQSSRMVAKSNLKFSQAALHDKHVSEKSIKEQPSKPHAPPYYYQRKIETASKKKIAQPVEFRIEVEVVDDSWPLNAEEWNNVTNPAPDGRLSTFLPSVKEATGRSDRTITKSTMSLRSNWKSGEPQTKSISPVRKLTKEHESSVNLYKPTISKPYWIMQTLVNHGEILDIRKNVKRETDLKDMKLKWVEHEPDRLKKGRQLRKEFLNGNLIPNSDKPCGESINTKRSVSKDDVAGYILPPFDLTPYMTKDPRTVDEDKRRLKTSAILEMDARNENASMDEAEEEHRRYIEKLEKLVNEQVDNHVITQKWLYGVRKESARMMEDATMVKIHVYEELTGKRFVPEFERGREIDDTKTKKNKKRSKDLFV